MNTNKRAEIRAQVVEILKDRTLCGQSVYASRGRSFFQMKLPELTVYTESEQSEYLNPPENRLKRTLKLVVEGAVIQKEKIDDELDLLSAEIEAALPSSSRPSLNGLIQSIRLTDTEIGLADKGEQLMGVVRLSFDIEYDA